MADSQTTKFRMVVLEAEGSGADIARAIEAALADEVICTRCGATLNTYADACTAALDDECPGFLKIEEARRGR